MDLSVIIVNWNVCDLLRRCLASVEANCDDLSLEVIVVDNASVDDSVQMVKREFPQVRLIASQENLGYTGGNNLGVNKAQGRYLLILNPDTEIVGDALPQMVAYLDENSHIAVVGPKLLYPDGTVQSSRRRFPTLAQAFIDDSVPFGRRWFPNSKLEQRYVMAEGSDDKIQAVDWLVGAALMIRREVWQKIGPLDETFFMYFEELDWCRRCRDAGEEIHYLPQAQIIHHHGAASGKIPVKKRIYLNRSKIIYYRKYFGDGWANLIRLFLLLNFTWVMLIELLKWTVSSHRETHWRRVQEYWQVLRSGLR
ncbi:MAG: glycosyltransferase family 2 protein [Anaerolineae bacterium]|nr:glycosyltransferase family 2 protein [Anaerolineae bacterium]